MLTITLLGTAATMPLPDRALTAAAAECGGTVCSLTAARAPKRRPAAPGST